MAAPPEKTVYNMNGKWQMNKGLCNDFDSVLQLQGIGWFVRKTIGVATITVSASSYKDDEGKDHLDIKQHLTGGIESTPEPRILDWAVREHKDSVFGDLEGRTRFISGKDLDEGYGKEDVDFLGEGWLEDTQIQSWVKNTKDGWTGNQVWGFQMVDGVRRYVRKAVVTNKKGEKKTAFLPYDYLGPLDEDFKLNA